MRITGITLASVPPRRPLHTAELSKEVNVHEATNEAADGTRQSAQAGYAGWLALGAVVAGTVGALWWRGGTRRSTMSWRNARRRSDRWPAAEDRPDSASLTAPHGDKLVPARE